MAHTTDFGELHEQSQEYCKRYYQDNRERLDDNRKKWNKNNPIKAKEIYKKTRENQKKSGWTENYKARVKRKIMYDILFLSDRYIKNTLEKSKGYNKIPPEVIELYREIMINNRLIKERNW